jgi:hypothetical protein
LIEEHGVKLPLLGIDDYEPIEAEALRLARVRTLADCDAAGLAGVDKFSTLGNIDPQGEVYNYLSRADGARKAIAAAAVKACRTPRTSRGRWSGSRVAWT